MTAKGKYAADTEVSASRSKAEIEATVGRYGATQFATGWDAGGQAMVGFAIEGRNVRFTLTLPARGDIAFTHHSRGERTPQAALAAWEQACRQRWRALALVIKAKLEAVETGIAVFDDEFMANIVLPGGRLVSDQVRPAIADAYRTGKVPPLLPDSSK